MYTIRTETGQVVIGPTNNWLKMHGYHHVRHTKRYPHERKWITKGIRIRYHAMKRAGCDDELIFRTMRNDYGEAATRKIVYWKEKRR